MSNIEMWNLIIGFLLPPVMAFAVQHHWSDQVRAVFAFGASLVAATVQTIIQQDGWDWHNWVSSVLFILVTAIATYKGFWAKAVPTMHNGGATNQVKGGTDGR